VQQRVPREGAIWDTDEIFQQEGIAVAYHQITPAERYTLATLRKQVPSLSNAAMARLMGRHRSTIARELARNSARYDGAYRPSKAQERTNGRRSLSRRNSRFTPSDWKVVVQLLREGLSPDQISGRLRLEGRLAISYESIYRFIRRDKRRGGELFRLLRLPAKWRKRNNGAERRGRLSGKRHISERPAAVECREEFGHWEMDTIVSAADRHCVVSLVERATGCVLLGKLRSRTVSATNRRVIGLIRRHRHLFKTITVDNGTEFHGYRDIERATGATFYFATPYHSWERGTNENTNGLLRQYVPKRRSMKHLTQARCDAIAVRLNNRPRKRHRYFSPIEVLALYTG
jgi:IS30 family transposase